MDASCKIQENIHVFCLVHNMCPGFWVHIISDCFFTAPFIILCGISKKPHKFRSPLGSNWPCRKKIYAEKLKSRINSTRPWVRICLAGEKLCGKIKKPHKFCSPLGSNLPCRRKIYAEKLKSRINSARSWVRICLAGEKFMRKNKKAA